MFRIVLGVLASVGGPAGIRLRQGYGGQAHLSSLINGAYSRLRLIGVKLRRDSCCHYQKTGNIQRFLI